MDHDNPEEINGFFMPEWIIKPTIIYHLFPLISQIADGKQKILWIHELTINHHVSKDLPISYT